MKGKFKSKFKSIGNVMFPMFQGIHVAFSLKECDDLDNVIPGSAEHYLPMLKELLDMLPEDDYSIIINEEIIDEASRVTMHGDRHVDEMVTFYVANLDDTLQIWTGKFKELPPPGGFCDLLDYSEAESYMVKAGEVVKTKKMTIHAEVPLPIGSKSQVVRIAPF